jgi:transposase
MVFKKTDPGLSFAEIALRSSLSRNRALIRMERINDLVDWSRIEELLVNIRWGGKGITGGGAYQPLLLLKGLLLRQWFCIASDRELETQINDRISFKKFLGLALDQPSPDHSTFSRFRVNLSPDKLEAIKHELRSQCVARGVSIQEGMVRDARLVLRREAENVRDQTLDPEGIQPRQQPSLPFGPEKKVDPKSHKQP